MSECVRYPSGETTNVSPSLLTRAKSQARALAKVQTWSRIGAYGMEMAGKRLGRGVLSHLKGPIDLGCRKMGSRALDFGLRLGEGRQRHKSEAVCFEGLGFRV